MKPKIFSNARLGSGIPYTPPINLHVATSGADRTYRMSQPGSWWLIITPAFNWVHEILAIEVRVTGPLGNRLIQQYRYIRRRYFSPVHYGWTRDATLDDGSFGRFARPQNIGTFFIPESPLLVGVTGNQNFPYRVASSFGPTYIHSYIIPDQTPHQYLQNGPPILGLDLPAIAPTSTPSYRSPDATPIGNEPRQPLHCFFTVGQDEHCEIRVRGYNHDVGRIPGFTDAIPEDSEPAADEIAANWTDANPPFGERPGFFILPVTL
jgi:hypothetical protein